MTTTALSINELIYSNSTYTITISLFNPDKIEGKNAFNYDNSKNVNILLSSVDELVISSSLTSPTLSGHITFKSEGINLYQLIFKEFYVYLNLAITENALNSKYDKIIHQFIITDIKILNTTNNSIIYKLEFISINSLKTNSNIYISTKGKPKSIVKIMEDTFAAADLQLLSQKDSSNTDNTVNAVSPTELIYTSSANDSLNTIIPYLQQKLLDPTLLTNTNTGDNTYDINSLNLITYTYNMYTDTYSLLNLNTLCNDSKLNADNIKPIIIPINKNEVLNGMSDAEFYQTPSIDRFMAFKNLASYFKYNFNFKTNQFTKNLLNSSIKTNILDNSFLNNSNEINKTYEKKYQSLDTTDNNIYYNYPGKSIVIFDKYYSTSSSNVSIYKDLINIFLGVDTVLIKIPANLNYSPGDIVYINISEKINPTYTYASKDNNGKLQIMGGLYIIVENRFVFEYNKTTKSPMFRNYIYLNRPVKKIVK